MRKVTARKLFSASCIGVALLLLFGCARGDSLTWSSIYTQQPATADSTEGGVVSEGDALRVCMPLAGGLWDPAVNSSQAMQGLMQLVYESPIRLDSALKPQGQLVGWTLAEDHVTWTFNVRSGIYFHDGSPLLAIDIVKSLDRILAVGAQGPYAWVLEDLVSWRAQGDSTVVVTAADRGYAALYAMTFPVMKLQGEEGYALGTGPYRLVRYEPEERLELIAQDHWWRKAPAIRSVTALARESTDAQIATFQLGETDAVWATIAGAVALRASAGDKTQEYMTGGYDALFFNFRHPMMADGRIRAAIARAIDRQDLITNIYQGHAIASELPIPSDSWLHRVYLDGFGFDAGAARQALEGIGFADVDADGLFDLKPEIYREAQLPAGTPSGGLPSPAPSETEAPEDSSLDGFLSGGSVSDPAMLSALLQPLRLITNYDKTTPLHRDAALRLRDQLQAAGLPVEVEAVDIAELPERIETGEYDLALLGYQIPLSNRLEFLLSSQDEGENSGYSVTNFTDSVLESLLREHANAVDDAAYLAALHKVGERILSEIPFVGLLFRTGTLAVREDLHPPASVREGRPFYAIEEWYFSGAQAAAT